MIRKCPWPSWRPIGSRNPLPWQSFAVHPLAGALLSKLVSAQGVRACCEWCVCSHSTSLFVAKQITNAQKMRVAKFTAIPFFKVFPSGMKFFPNKRLFKSVMVSWQIQKPLISQQFLCCCHFANQGSRKENIPRRKVHTLYGIISIILQMHTLNVVALLFTSKDSLLAKLAVGAVFSVWQSTVTLLFPILPVKSAPARGQIMVLILIWTDL